MIIARASNQDGAEMFIIGLSSENMLRLGSGQPILIKRDTHGEGVPEGWEIFLFTGTTEDSMVEILRAHGFIGPETHMHKSPKL